jgi:carbon starvation protein
LPSATYGLFGTTAAGRLRPSTSGLQLVFAVLLVVLGVIVAYNCLKEFFTKKAGSIPDEEPEWSELGRKHAEESKHDVAVDAKTEVTA